jgi:mono/diheme cytochrome c family protein
MLHYKFKAMRSGLKPVLSVLWRLGIGIYLFSLILFSGCDRGNNDPGWDYFPDMMYSPAYQTWSENPVLNGEMTMQHPVDGTISRNMIPFQYEKTDSDLERAGKELVNPFESTEDNITRGAKVYSVYCMLCHGVKGDGSGHLYTSGRYIYPPASLVSDKVKDLQDGSIFHVISVGWGIMAAHAPIVLPEDRWKAILYIRQELQAKAN